LGPGTLEREQEINMHKAIILAAGLALAATSALAQGSWRDRDDDDRRGWREDRREWSRDRDRDGMRGRSTDDMRDDDEGGPRAARFHVRSGDARMGVRCDERESMRACVDAALTMFDRIRSQQGTGGTTSSAPASPGGSPASPAPAR
jgi:hypothetical protein